MIAACPSSPSASAASELLGEHHYVAHDATLVGDITLHNNANVWFQVVIRAENDHITIGEGSNIQDASVLHVDPGYPMTLGRARQHRPQGDAAWLHHRRGHADRHQQRGAERREDRPRQC